MVAENTAMWSVPVHIHTMIATSVLVRGINVLEYLTLPLEYTGTYGCSVIVTCTYILYHCVDQKVLLCFTITRGVSVDVVSAVTV